MTNLEKYYNKFKEDHRLTTRHGIVEYTTSMKYIHDYIGDRKDVKIADIGAGTGRYSVALAEEGYDVTAVELVKHNLEVLESKHAKVKCWPGNALDLHFLSDSTFDITILFGPMYHLHTKEDKLKALKEASRITKKDGIILVGYCMNDYSVITYCFKKGKIKECMEKGTLTPDFKAITNDKDDLYSYIRTDDINELDSLAGLKRLKIFAPDGAADYMRVELNALDEESFAYFIQYQLQVCERSDLIGASSHTVDVLLNTKE